MLFLITVFISIMGGFLSIVLYPNVDVDIAFIGGTIATLFIFIALYIALKIFK